MSSRIYTVKPLTLLDGGDNPVGRRTGVSLPREWVTVTSAGFAKKLTLQVAAKLIGCDAGELKLQMDRRQGMTHVVVRKHQHWYC